MSTVAKRLFDLVFTATGLIAISPLLLLIAVLVKIGDRGPVFFWQHRVGQHGVLFRMLKFRSMTPNAEAKGLSITANGDPRVTRIGWFLRRHKLDELPQLWNVFLGEMSFVGPRPEVPRYVNLYTREQRRVLALKPGITDMATIAFRNEEELLRQHANDTEKFYIEYCVPRKIELNLAYAAKANLWRDISVILKTIVPRLGKSD